MRQQGSPQNPDDSPQPRSRKESLAPYAGFGTHPTVSVAATGATLPGLSAEETEEFLRLDQSLPYDGLFVWPDELPAIPSEERWRILWAKQCAAFGG